MAMTITTQYVPGSLEHLAKTNVTTDIFLFVGSLLSNSFSPSSLTLIKNQNQNLYQHRQSKRPYNLFFCTDLENQTLEFFTPNGAGPAKEKRNMDLVFEIVSRYFDQIIFVSPQVNDHFQKNLFAMSAHLISIGKRLDYEPTTMSVLRAPIAHEVFLVGDGGGLGKHSLTVEQLSRRGIVQIRHSPLLSPIVDTSSRDADKTHNFNVAVVIDNDDFCSEAVNMFDNLRKSACASKQNGATPGLSCELFLITTNSTFCRNMQQVDTNILPNAHNIIGITGSTITVAYADFALKQASGSKKGAASLPEKIISSVGSPIYAVDHDNKAGLSVALSECTVLWVVAEKPYLKNSSPERLNTIIAEGSAAGSVPLIVTSFFDKIQLGPKDELDVEGVRVPTELLIHTQSGHWIGTAWDGVGGGAQNLVSYTVSHMEHHQSKRNEMRQKAIRSAAQRSETSFVDSLQSVMIDGLMTANFRAWVKSNVDILRKRQTGGMKMIGAIMPPIKVFPAATGNTVLIAGDTTSTTKHASERQNQDNQCGNPKHRCVALIVEPRVSPTFEYSVRNVMQFLGPNWALEVHHSTGPWGNEWFVKDVLRNTFKAKDNFVPLTHRLKDGHSYNKLLKSKEFWERLAKVLFASLFILT